MYGIFLAGSFCLFIVSCNVKQDPYDSLYEAIRKGDEKEVRKIIDSGIDVNPSNKNWTPLMIAVLRKNATLTDMLLNNGADIQKRNNKGQTPLHLAARWGKPEIAEHLIERGAFIEARDWLSWTPLMWASLRGRDDMVKNLLEKSANPNVKDIDGNTPLMLACWHGHTSTAKIIISFGGNKFARNGENKTACDIAREKQFPATLKAIEPCI